MYRTALICVTALCLGAVAVVALIHQKQVQTVTQYVPLFAHQQQEAPAHKAIYFDPVTVDQLRTDLNGKVCQVGTVSHQFFAPELNYMSIVSSRSDERYLNAEVQICSDATVTQRKGLLGLRKSSTHENCCGCVRVYYERVGDQWVFRSVENIDLQKLLTPVR